jgi:predicted hydrocarbon binding protein
LKEGSTPIYRYSEEMGKIYLQAMQEVVGSQAVRVILKAANIAEPSEGKQLHFGQISRIQSALEQIYGLRGGQGVALRCGRVSFQYGLREFGEQSGCTNLEFRLLPFNTKLRVGAELLARILNENSGQKVQVSDQGEHLFWNVEDCPVCLGRHTEGASCHLTVGILQESLFWVSGGKFFNVEETHCIAKGDPTCTIVVHKKPLG